jgi:hypothetical protein
VYSRLGPDKKTVRSEELFSGYRLVDGLHVPFEARVLQNGRPVLTRTITEIRVNGPVPDMLFARPE